jgi:HAE1 family hydrophobic/amphiphilic exporter-1
MAKPTSKSKPSEVIVKAGVQEATVKSGFSLAHLSINRPIFVTCIVLLVLLIGVISMNSLGLDLFPEVEVPVVMVTVPYRGAGPQEIETLIAKPLEDQLSTLGGLKRVLSTCGDGYGRVTCQFQQKVDAKYAEQQVRDRVQIVRPLLPKDIDEPVVQRLSFSDVPVVQMALSADLPPAQMYDLAHDVLKPGIEQVNGVGLVDLLGGRKREIQVELDRAKLKAHELSASAVAQKIGENSLNVPVGTLSEKEKQKSYRTLGEYRSVKEIEDTLVNFYASDVPVRVKDVGKVSDGLEDAKSHSYLNGRPALTFLIFKQSGTNTVEVVDGAIRQMGKLNERLKGQPGSPQMILVRDNAKWVRQNLEDVSQTIAIGILLVVVVVYFFLGNFRSMVITSLALPNSLLGAFILMKLAGFTINIMTLLSLSLAVGLLIDDAIVVRENIFRHIENGVAPLRAALEGTLEVTLAVIATSLVVIAVFLPVGFLSGTVGQFMRQFGLTMCFIMAISLFDALTIAPMLSAYFAGRHQRHEGHQFTFKSALGGAVFGGLSTAIVGSLFGGKTGMAIGFLIGAVLGSFVPRLVPAFQRFEDGLDKRYERILNWILSHRLLTLGGALLLAMGGCIGGGAYAPKTFIPNSDNAELQIDLNLPPGTSLDRMDEVARQVEDLVRKHPEVSVASTTVGSREGEPNEAQLYVALVPPRDRTILTNDFKEVLRHELVPFKYANPRVGDVDISGGNQKPYTLVLKGEDLKTLDDFSLEVMAALRKGVPGLADPDSSFRGSKPEFQVNLDDLKAGKLGVSTVTAGMELRTLVDGAVGGKFREQGKEYDIRVRLQPDQRDLEKGYAESWVPNANYNLVRLSAVSTGHLGEAPSSIDRQDRSRSVIITGDLGPRAGFADLINGSEAVFKTLKFPKGVTYEFVGTAEDFADMQKSMQLAFFLAFCIMYMVLASLYESFITPFTILLALPLAAAGALAALALVTFASNSGLLAALHRMHLAHVDRLDASINLFSLIGMILLMGLVAKNSILLVDYAHQLIKQGVDRRAALIKAGITRLRPILMTSIALILGALPIALAISEVGRFRSSMGIAIVGGLISSTGLTLLVVPAAFGFIDDFRMWIEGWFRRIGQ